jgi:hypothetical protein
VVKQPLALLADDDLRPVTALFVLAGIEVGEPTPVVSEVEAAGHGLEGEQAGVDGMVGVGDELELESGVFFGDCRHAVETKPPERNHHFLQGFTSIVMIGDLQ